MWTGVAANKLIGKIIQFFSDDKERISFHMTRKRQMSLLSVTTLALIIIISSSIIIVIIIIHKYILLYESTTCSRMIKDTKARCDNLRLYDSQ